MKSKITKISLFSGLILILILWSVGGQNSTSGAIINCPLKPAEMLRTFGSCPNCTLGEDEQTECDHDSCPGCEEGTTICHNKYIGTGNWFGTCKSTGINDGTCLEGEMIDCAYEHYCPKESGPTSPRSCDEGSCIIPPSGGTDCVECSDGSRTRKSPSQQRDDTCTCG